MFKDDLVSLASSCVYWQPAACCHAAGVQAEENINNTAGRQHMLFQKEKKRKRKKLEMQQHIFMRIPHGNKAQQRINLQNYFCGKLSLSLMLSLQ